MGTPSSLETFLGCYHEITYEKLQEPKAKALNRPVNEPVLMEKAEAFAKEWNVLFTMSTGWFERLNKSALGEENRLLFWLRLRILDCCPRIVLDHVSQQQAENWLNGTLLKLFGGYPVKDIFSADATATFFHCLPQKTQTNYDALSRARETACSYSAI
ncbi:Tigger transposable element-derived protein [Trichinella spiralis]|uniref:Tigger transposable element-derived protein n=1 Tax=Trichinella spiralis TaxID=6334 RepID=A0ABR3KB71_TRISP